MVLCSCINNHVDGEMLAAEVIQAIPEFYEKALSAGDLFFFPSSVHKYEELGIQFEIRLCPALLKKPALPAPHFDQSKPPGDPFLPPHNSKLLVGSLDGSNLEQEYVVIMNKFSVVPRHFLLVTKQFESQGSPLTPDDLLATYQILNASWKLRQPIFAFYNCGDLSGASQPHKHIQFLPLDDDDGPPIEHLARDMKLENPDRPFSLTSLPYANHLFRFPPRFAGKPASEQQSVLSNAFLSLLDLVISTIRHDEAYPSGRPSFNVVMTLEHIHLIPRRQESYEFSDTEKLPVNALGFAGMLLAKSQEELEVVKTCGVGKILASVGLKSVHDIQVAGTSLEIQDLVVDGA